MKTLKLSEEAALRLYPTAAPEFKQMLEENFGKEFFNQDITDKIKDYDDICECLGVDSDDDALVVKVEGFDKADINFIKAVIKKVRIAKVYNQGWFPKKGDKRYYAWFQQSASGSGFVFGFASYDGSVAYATSASRLCFENSKLAEDAANKFIDIENDLIDLKK